jgi:hypothetical protein
MHILFALLILLVLAIWFYRATNVYVQAPAAATPAASAPPMKLAWVAEGKLFYQSGFGGVQQIHSPYAQGAIDRAERSREKNAWKKETAFGISAQGGHRAFDQDIAPIRISSARFVANGELLYFQHDTGMGGLFSYDPVTGAETRLLHRQHLLLEDLSLSASGETIYCTIKARDGTSHIGMMSAHGDGLRELTGGDSLDSSAAAVPGQEHVLLYQSAGIARNQQGVWVATGNATIQELNTQTGRVTPVLEDARYDYLSPRVAPDGNLYFIRRPFEQRRYGAGNIVLDTLFFPFRLLRAVFHYLNFFSLMYSRKPLTGAGGPSLQADMKNIILQGKVIDAQKALRKEASIAGVPSLVPSTWQLVCRNRAGAETVVACNVSSFDISPKGQVVYSNGRGLFAAGESGPALLTQGSLVGDILVHDLTGAA